MSQESLRIVFFGTPEFSVPVLDALHKSRHEIVAVVTAVDKLGGRGKKNFIESAIKKHAVKLGLPILQPKNLKAETFVAELASYKADVQIVVAFRMLPVVVWDMPDLGTINLHASLLPQYRGAAPINWAIIKGEKVTGMTTFKLKHEIDTGNIIHQHKMRIDDNDTAGTLYHRMMEVSGEFLLQTVDEIANGTVQFYEQDSSKVTKAPKLFRDNCELDFDDTSLNVRNKVRGLNPYPGAWARLASGEVFKILEASLTDENDQNLQPGMISVNGQNLLIKTTDGFLKIEELQMEGKKRMKVADFLNGYKFEESACFKFSKIIDPM